MAPGPRQAHDERPSDVSALLRHSVFALLGTAAACVVLAALGRFIGPFEPLLVLLLPVMTAATFGGGVPGGVAILTAAVVSNGLWFGPAPPFTDAVSDRGDLVLFVVVGLGVSGLGARLKMARERERSLRRTVEEEVQRFELIAEAVPDVICAFGRDPAGRVSFPYANEKIVDIFGLPPESLRADAAVIFAMMHPDDAERLRQSIDDSARSLTIWRDEFRIRRGDGSEIWVEGHSAPVTQADGGIVWYGIIADVTARKRAAATAERWQRLFERANIGIAAADPATDTWVAANDTYAAWRGYTPAELIGRQVESAYPDEWRDASTASVREAERTGHCVYDTELLRQDGSRFPAMVDLTVIKDGAGRPIERVGFIIDLSARRRAEDAARIWQRAFEQSGLAIGLSDTNLRFVAVNEAFARARGYTAAELAGRPVASVFPEDTWPAVAAFIGTAGEHWHLETEHCRKDGGRFPVLIDATGLRDETGRIVMRVAFVLDLTSRVAAEQASRRHERQLRELNAVLEARVEERTAQLEAANRELEAFAYSVSHDLRAPLRGMDGWSLALLEDYGAQLDDRARQYLDRVRTEAQRMRLLIDDLLQLSRVGRAPLVPVAVDVSALATAVVARLTEDRPGRPLEFHIEPGLSARGDQRLIEIALTNLLDNAVKFSGGGTPARIDVGRAELPDGGAAFFVRDNGVGFDMAYADTLFRPFKRLHKASEFTGTGIGLATVQRIVNRHGGHIWVEARTGQGATFFFRLAPDGATV